MIGVDRTVVTDGNRIDYPRRGDWVRLEYIGFLYDPTQPHRDFKGRQFDTSIGRGEFVSQIGEGKMIRGWDQAVMQMSLGERACISVASDLAYGPRGFPGYVPPSADLIFDMELKAINEKRAA